MKGKHMFIEKNKGELLEISHELIPTPNENHYFRHIHSFCELLLFVKGDAEYNIDGNIYNLNSYDLLFIPSAIYHYLILNTSSPYENYVLKFQSSFLSSKLYEKIFSAPFILNIKNDPILCNCFSMFDYYYEMFSHIDFYECSACLLKELLIYCSYKTKDSLSSDKYTDSLVKKAIIFISDNIRKPLNSSIIAKHFMVSKSHFQNSFSKVMHIGIKQYINQKKIYAAQIDLQNGSSPQEVAEKYCFNNYSSFYRQYKKIIGSSPRTEKK